MCRLARAITGIGGGWCIRTFSSRQHLDLRRLPGRQIVLNSALASTAKQLGSLLRDLARPSQAIHLTRIGFVSQKSSLLPQTKAPQETRDMRHLARHWQAIHYPGLPISQDWVRFAKKLAPQTGAPRETGDTRHLATHPTRDPIIRNRPVLPGLGSFRKKTCASTKAHLKKRRFASPLITPGWLASRYDVLE